jgi:polyisoprenyl-teichoic acid--peptidoglycan teichoic acid transferase
MSRSLTTLLCAALCLVLAGCGGLAAKSDGDGTDRGTAPPVKTARATPRPTPTPEPTPAPVQVSDLVGKDGRFTVLLLGSDHRKGIVGERTDAIIVASIDPILGKVGMVSLPRDTVNVPIAPGQVHSDRINTLYFDLLGSKGKRKAALNLLRQRLAYALDIEIDRAALVDFDGLTRLIDSIGGVDVRLKQPLIDPSMHIGSKGLRLKAGRQHLDGKEALAFSRSRHTDSDYERSRRQQQVIIATAAKVRERGLAALPALVELVRKKMITDIPLSAAPALLELAASADLKDVGSVVLEPPRWTRVIPGTYEISPRVVEIQKLLDRMFQSVG